MHIRKIYIYVWFLLVLSACGLNPQNVDLDLNQTLPEAKTTVYNDSVRKIGMMGVIYGVQPLKIMSNDIVDNTGTSVATNAEIPRDITEMVKSTLNGIGGNVTFIPYDPNFMANTMNTGYTQFDDKLIPDVVVSGGITEFDRALVTKGDTFDIDVEVKTEYGVSFEDRNKGSLAQVTLDFNLIDFKTFAGIPRIQAVNGIKLHKAIKEDSIGFTIKSATFGAQGTVKKIQGRHAAVRLLVQLSMIQIIGRYQKLPYWRLIPGAEQDSIVMDQVIADYYGMSRLQKIKAFQTYLYLLGYAVQITGHLDPATESALHQFATKHGLTSGGIDQATYLALFENIPIDHLTQHKRKNLPIPAPIMTPNTPPLPRVATSPFSTTSKKPGILNLWTNKTNFSPGESLIVRFNVNQSMYVRIVLINSEGKVSTLFPNMYQNDNFCRPGITYQIPPENGEFLLEIGAEKGTDKIRAVASKNPIPSDALSFTAAGDFDEEMMPDFSIRAASNIEIQ